jgi:hypothetical protein
LAGFDVVVRPVEEIFDLALDLPGTVVVVPVGVELGVVDGGT